MANHQFLSAFTTDPNHKATVATGGTPDGTFLTYYLTVSDHSIAMRDQPLSVTMLDNEPSGMLDTVTNTTTASHFNNLGYPYGRWDRSITLKGTLQTVKTSQLYSDATDANGNAIDGNPMYYDPASGTYGMSGDQMRRNLELLQGQQWMSSSTAPKTYQTQTGSVTLSAGSKTVTGSGTSFASSLAGEYAHFGNNPEPYRIASVGSTTSLTLDRQYPTNNAGTTMYATTGASFDRFPLYYAYPYYASGYGTQDDDLTFSLFRGIIENLTISDTVGTRNGYEFTLSFICTNVEPSS